MAGMIAVLTALPVLAVDRPALRIGDPLPVRTFQTLAGTSMSIPDATRGKVTVIHFWTDRCGNCRKFMPDLEVIRERYREKGFEVLAVNVGQDKSTVMKFVAETHIKYPVLLDPEKASVGTYSVVGLPRTYLIDRKGIVRYKIVGEAPEQHLIKLIQELL